MSNKDEIRSIIDHIKSRYHKLENVYWFGSSRNNFDEAGDIDLLVKLEGFDPIAEKELIEELESESIFLTRTLEPFGDDPKPSPPPPPPPPLYQNPIIRPKGNRAMLFSKPIHISYITNGEIEKTDLFLFNKSTMEKVA